MPLRERLRSLYFEKVLPLLDKVLKILRRKNKIPDQSPVEKPPTDQPDNNQNLSQAVDHSRHVSVQSPKDGYKRPPLEGFYAYLLAILIGYWLADLAVLSVRDKFIPQSTAPIPPQKGPLKNRPLLQQYDIITQRNLFNAEGFIPPPLSGGNIQDTEDMGQPALSQLPLKLIGTIVHANPTRSVATIQVQGKKISPYLPRDDMESIAQLLKVERFTAILRNNQNGRLEYIEIKDDGIKLSVQTPMAPRPPTSQGPQRQGNNVFLRRSDVNRYIQNLPALLQQARAVPSIDPGTGAVNGFRLVEIQPGSLYERLGFQRNDLIQNVNGEPVDSPAKAMELYNSLKTDSNITIDVDRNGTQETLSFSIE